MQNRLTKTVALAAVACSAWLGGCLHREQSGLVVLKSYLSTNMVPGYIGGPVSNQQIGPDGYLLPNVVNAVAVNYPPRTNTVTNYIIGYRRGTQAVEVLRVP